MESKPPVKISGFILVHLPETYQYPYIECIESWLDFVDELVLVVSDLEDSSKKYFDGLLSNKKIKIVYRNWEKHDWPYSRLGQNFNTGFANCTGDIVFKIDLDWVLHENSWDGSQRGGRSLKVDCQKMFDSEKYVMVANKKNFILADRYFIKSPRTIAFNKTLVSQNKLPIKVGLDLKKWSWGNEFIQPKFNENGIHFGDLYRNKGTQYLGCANIFNYDYIFRTKDVAIKHRKGFLKAEEIQKTSGYKKIPQPVFKFEYKDTEDWLIGYNTSTYKKYQQYSVDISEHPRIIRNKLVNFPKDLLGYNVFNSLNEHCAYAAEGMVGQSGECGEVDSPEQKKD